MRPPTICDRKLIHLIDKEKMSQSAAAKELGVSRQAVNQRLKELRGRTTKAIVSRETKRILKQSFDAVDQLNGINAKTLDLLDQAEQDGAFSLKCIAELRNQIRLAMEIQERIYNQRAAQQFMEIIIDVLRNVSPDAYKKFRQRINSERAIRAAIKFT